ncbi:NUDIX domain-containing protein [Alkalinema sp. FACHB-956]|uniref:NUDIX hydrolase n=1 Tax=Alkalinema sp. FACHB-956 TaxID=2692768 RepID=UPI0016896466|nr:NUDIX domain-containing protein [Alkalinema sp. FACHB-956]MBD2327679.1 NUDIX domain-containing protein [Alkalinema sp. FACHB-956]
MNLSPAPSVKRKVLAYITHQEELLVFRQEDYPYFGIQVPGGSIESGEAIVDALLREVYEETGLKAVQVVDYLGSFWKVGQARMREYHAFHLQLTAPAPRRWRHYEEFSGARKGPIAFDFFWVPLGNADWTLFRGQEMVPWLRRSFPAAFPQPVIPQALTMGAR